MRILGIDPGYAIVGYAVLDFHSNRFTPVDIGQISTKAGVPFTTRLNDIYEDMVSLIDTYSPEQVAIEELFSNTNVKTVIKVGQARGVILLAAKRAGVPVFEYTPLQVKSSLTGFGRADKKQVQEMTKKILGLSGIIRPDDAADAAALAITHGYTVTSRKLVTGGFDGEI
ncbi:MAG: crossover junction endodeoxyribonuclease RuvC [Ruminococcus sp.]|nr:crossover junction endodeoxyribonuclease RuvC [Ruminococcus sp.]